MASFFWAMDGLIRYPLLGDGVSAQTLVFYEHVILCAVFSLFFFKNFQKILNTKLEDLIYFILLGVGGSAIATMCFTKAFVYLNPSLVIVIQKAQPVIAVLLARAMLNEKITLKFVLWASVCLFGVVLIGFEHFQSLSFNEILNFESHEKVKGYLLTFVAVIGWGASTVIGKKLTTRGYKVKEIMSGRFFMALIGITPFVFFTDHVTLAIELEQLGRIALLVLVSGLLGMYLYYKGMKFVPARVITLGELFFPLGAVILNWIFLDLTMTTLQMIGAILLMGGASMIQFKKY